jgi:nicotinamide riboside transporter PnuC
MIWLEWVSTAASFLGTLLVARHHNEGWLVNFLADVGFVIFALNKRLFGFLSLCLGYAIINLYGYFQ